MGYSAFIGFFAKVKNQTYLALTPEPSSQRSKTTFESDESVLPTGQHTGRHTHATAIRDHICHQIQRIGAIRQHKQLQPLGQAARQQQSKPTFPARDIVRPKCRSCLFLQKGPFMDQRSHGSPSIKHQYTISVTIRIAENKRRQQPTLIAPAIAPSTDKS